MLHVFGAHSRAYLGVALADLEALNDVPEANLGRHLLRQVVVDRSGDARSIPGGVVQLENENGERNGQASQEHDHS